jgi:hypothetical protein
MDFISEDYKERNCFLAEFLLQGEAFFIALGLKRQINSARSRAI